MRMGYHRDPSHYPEISIFHGELRRRAWILIRHMDIVVSSWVGLPRLVDSRHADTRPPRNLLDQDLDENMTELPPSRPEEAAVSYATMKTDILILFANVVDEVSCINQPSYSRIMELDRVLHDFYASLRSHFQLSEETMKTNPARFLRRLMLNVIYQKARCVLHRNYISSMREEHRYSRYSCVDAAMRILTDISMSYDGDMPNSSLYPLAWSLPAAFTNDLLLASMIVCVDLERAVRGIRETERPPGDLLEWTKEQKIQALRKAYKTLQSPSLGPSEVSEGVKIIRIVLENATKTVVQSQHRQESHYSNQQLSQNRTDRDGQGLIEPASATVEDESLIPGSSAQPSWAISSSVEYAMPVDNAGEFLAASMMDPVQFMMEVPLDFGSGFWTATASSNVEVPPDMPWDFDGNSQFNGNL
ncbi:hypothetical protein DTO169E5_7058 [Paecilomyces variotii]|nr:hypothetical protein DTO169E5_7058 [Paecilomyces variotii]KAJ9298078.1 hypothetical protein DTO217A2_8464 [Paecilomyces variotii]